MTRSRHITLVAVAIAALAGLGPALRASQGLAGVQANWHDLETWSHVSDDALQNELGLGLQPDGSGGAMLIAFLGRLSTREPDVPPAEIRVQVAAGVLANPNLVRRATLTFLVDAGTEKRVALDLTSRLVVDDSFPGGNIQNGLASMSTSDFLRLTEAKTVSGNIFGFEVALSRDEIAAMKAFAQKLNLTRAK